MSINTVGVIGAGVMGGGIAQLFAEHGTTVLLHDADTAALLHGCETISARLAKSMEKGSLTPQQVDGILSRILLVPVLDGLRSADLVIEAIVEDAAAKTALYAALGGILSDTAILGTNTSSLSVTDLAAASPRPGQFLGIHFFNPPTRLALVEVVPTTQTDPAVLAAVTACLQQQEKTPVVVKDSPGFIVNRLLLLMINEAARMVDEGVASAEDIDTAMRLGALHPAGPLAVADLIGLDTCAHILRTLHRDLGESSYAPADAITTRVDAGKLGRKSGEGFFGK